MIKTEETSIIKFKLILNVLKTTSAETSFYLIVGNQNEDSQWKISARESED